MIDTTNFKKMASRYEASMFFKKGQKIYFFFKANNGLDSSDKYLLFNPKLSFTVNFELAMKRFNSVRGFWHLYTDDDIYEVIPTLKSKSLFDF